MPSRNKTNRNRQQQQKTKSDDRIRLSASAVKQQRLNTGLTLSALILIVFIGLLAYSNTFNAPFEFDDNRNILKNPFIRMTRISIDAFNNVLNSPSNRRPLANLTFAINYYLHQYDETGYHIVNIAIHLINAFLVFIIIRQTLILCRSKNTWIAILAALIWLTNPVHTQSVTYIVQRMNSLAVMFYLLALLSYIQGRFTQRRDSNAFIRPALLFSFCALAGLFGLLSKEIAMTLPVMIFLYEWFFFQNLDMSWFRRQARWIIVILIILAIIMAIYLKGNLLARFSSKYTKLELTMVQRLLSESSVVIYYLSLLFYPSPDRLRVIYQISPAVSLFSPVTTLLSLTALASLVTAALILRNRYRIISFTIVWFLITLIVESSIIPLALAFEHRTYLPSTFALIAPVYLLFRKTTAKNALCLTCAAIVLFGFWTWQRNAVWSDEVTFWTDAAWKAPGDIATFHNLGAACAKKGDLETALTHYNAALKINRNNQKTYNCIGTILVQMNRTAEAMSYFKTAIKLKADNDDAYLNLGLALDNMNRTEEAEHHYRRALELNPLLEKAHTNLGIILMNRGMNDIARTHFKRALAINPNSGKPYNSLGISFFRTGEIGRALTYFKKALTLNPDNKEAAGNLEKATRALKQYGQTIVELQKTRQQHPENPEIALQLAAVYLQADMEDLAVDLYERVLSMEPGCEVCLDALTRIFITSNRYDRAAQMLERLTVFHPDNPNFLYSLACAYAKDNQKGKAVESLEKAVNKGFTDINHIRTDKNLKVIRDTDYFRFLTAGQ